MPIEVTVLTTDVEWPVPVINDLYRLVPELVYFSELKPKYLAVMWFFKPDELPVEVKERVRSTQYFTDSYDLGIPICIGSSTQVHFEVEEVAGN